MLSVGASLRPFKRANSVGPVSLANNSTLGQTALLSKSSKRLHAVSVQAARADINNPSYRRSTVPYQPHKSSSKSNGIAPNSSPESLAAQLLANEANLRDLFAPGRIQPRAVEVTRMRKVGQELRAAIAAALKSKGGERKVQAQGVPVVMIRVALEKAQKSTKLVQSLLDQHADTDIDDRDLPYVEAAELASVQFENKSLRRQAAMIMRRHKQVETQMKKYGLISRKTR